MSLGCHLEALFNLLIAWEADIQERLGYIPKDFQSCRYRYITNYLTAIENELDKDMQSIKKSRAKLKKFSGQKVSIDSQN